MQFVRESILSTSCVEVVFQNQPRRHLPVTAGLFNQTLVLPKIARDTEDGTGRKSHFEPAERDQGFAGNSCGARWIAIFFALI
jgi:hypothetical protein